VTQTAALSPVRHRSPVAVRLIGVAGVVALALAAISIATGVHLWMRATERLVCPSGTELDAGAWADASWCVSSTGALSSPSTRTVGWFQPGWSALLVAAVVVIAGAGGFWAARAIWRR